MGGVRAREGRRVCVGRVVSGGKGSDLFAGWREALRLGVAAGKLQCVMLLFSLGCGREVVFK